MLDFVLQLVPRDLYYRMLKKVPLSHALIVSILAFSVET
jgi:hypothetical protein